jgi:hypothetical protein
VGFVLASIYHRHQGTPFSLHIEASLMDQEGLEAVVFVGGVRLIPFSIYWYTDEQVSLGIPAVSIPIAVIVGLIAGAIVGM